MDGIIFVKLVAAFWRVLTQEMAPVKFDTGFMIETGCPKWDSQFLISLLKKESPCRGRRTVAVAL